MTVPGIHNTKDHGGCAEAASSALFITMSLYLEDPVVRRNCGGLGCISFLGTNAQKYLQDDCILTPGHASLPFALVHLLVQGLGI